MSPSRARVIAEIGVNHNGSISLAKELIDCAADCGAQVAKFQVFLAEDLVTASAGKAPYQKSNDSSSSQLEMLRKYELGYGAFADLQEYCANRGVEFLASGFSQRDLGLIFDLGVTEIKIPSGEINNFPYLETAASRAKKIILSTGMATLVEVRQALDRLLRSNAELEIVVLQCTSSYPTHVRDINLRAMVTMQEEFGLEVGLSDHSKSVLVPALAVAMGASVIEKHLTLDQSLPGPDHRASLNPEEFKAMTGNVHEAQLALGNRLKEPSPGELENLIFARKSIVAATLIRENEEFTANNLTVRRPANGISPVHWEETLGKRAIREFLPDEPIEL